MEAGSFNPFTPTFGSIPPELAGRKHLIEDVMGGLENGPGDPNRATIFVGARGTGKTVLLAAIAEQAREHGWVGIDVTARAGLLEEILVQAREKASHLLTPETTARLTGVQVSGFGFTVSPQEKRSTWRAELTRIVQELNDAGAGLLISVDEVSADLDELKILVEVFQHFVRERRDVAIMLAGLPHNVSMILRDDSISFLRRAFRHSLGPIADNDVAYAMRETIEGAGRTIEPKALELAAGNAKGFAFLIQLIGYHLWRQHPGAPTITVDDAELGIAAAKRQMFQMIIEPSLNDLTTREREFVNAMAQDEDASSIGDIAERMGIDANNASKVRRRLVERGVISGRGRGRVGFDIPMLADYLRG